MLNTLMRARALDSFFSNYQGVCGVYVWQPYRSVQLSLLCSDTVVLATGKACKKLSVGLWFMDIIQLYRPEVQSVALLSTQCLDKSVPTLASCSFDNDVTLVQWQEGHPACRSLSDGRLL